MTAGPIRRVLKEFREVPPDATLADIIDNYNDLVFEINDVFRTLNMSSLNGEIITFTLKPGENTISHRLGVAPSHRVTLKSVGGDGIVNDVSFNSKEVVLDNKGTLDVEITMILVKG